MKREPYVSPTMRAVVLVRQECLLSVSGDSFREGQTDQADVYDDEGADPAEAL